MTGSHAAHTGPCRLLSWPERQEQLASLIQRSLRSRVHQYMWNCSTAKVNWDWWENCESYGRKQRKLLILALPFLFDMRLATWTELIVDLSPASASSL